MKCKTKKNMVRAISALLLFGFCLSVGAGHAEAKKPNIVVIWGDDIGRDNLSVFSKGMMGYRPPNIDRIASEGMLFTDAYTDRSCSASRASFATIPDSHAGLMLGAARKV
jgi:hypothetical protein